MNAALLRGVGGDRGNAVNALAMRARRASAVTLVFFEAGGLILALSIYAWAPRRWPLILPCVALSAFGLWGLCDRFIESKSGRRFRTHRKILRWLERLIAALGIAAALGAAYLVIGWVMGVYIS
jgi:hypothetical protein